MRRRDFLELSLMGTAALCGGPAFAAPPARATLALHPARTGHIIAPSFTGLSYESAVLSNPDFFSGDNADLAGYLRRLGRDGILRIGGNTSEYSVWSPEGAPSADALAPDTGKHAAPRRPITPAAIRNLRDFLDAAGWRLIYGLNLGSEGPDIAAAEAAAVASVMGPKLLAFQIGNEADLFNRNGLRPPTYDPPQFLAEWRRYADAVRARVPGAPIAGPDTAVENTWLFAFAQKFGRDVPFLSHHYYAEGPPDDPAMTIERLLSPANPRLKDLLDAIAGVQKIAPGTPFRLSETNSCYQGGKHGVSDTFAAALWGADLMYRIASAGAVGINFHGGGYGWYTPVAGTREAGFLARPIYYGMLLFAEAGPGALVETALDTAEAPLLTAYAVKTGGAVKLVLINKNLDRDVRLDLDPGLRAGAAQVQRLLAPRIDDMTDTSFGGSVVGAGGAWSAAVTERVAPEGGKFTLSLPRASAALVTLAA